ncbi:hypothetical protein I4U23_022735 [Adineta vaga]|nr:hypothetical protein I4U23_022735 [Adineta vaga]
MFYRIFLMIHYIFFFLDTPPTLCYGVVNNNKLFPLNKQLLSKFTHIRDAQVIYPLLVNVDNYVLATIPSDTVYIGLSSIPNAGQGAFAARPIARLSYFGPYCCDKHNDSHYAAMSSYTWEVLDESGQIMHYVDAAKFNKSNWLRYINCANTLAQQNLIAFITNGDVFYLVVRNISVGEELLVYYGNNYARKLGIDPDKFYS